MNEYISPYCVHGNYIGYPGGADYMCQLCEDGLYKAKTGYRYKISMRFSNDTKPVFIEYRYSKKESDNRVKQFNEIKTLHNADSLNIISAREKYTYWSK